MLEYFLCSLKYIIKIVGVTASSDLRVLNGALSVTYEINITGNFDLTLEVNNPIDSRIVFRDYSATQPSITQITSFEITELTGLVASYNMIPSKNGVLVDVSHNGNNGTIWTDITFSKPLVAESTELMNERLSARNQVYENIKIDPILNFFVAYQAAINIQLREDKLKGIDTFAPKQL